MMEQNEHAEAPVDHYWATVEPQELASQMNRLVDAYLDDLELSGRLDVWRRAIRLYFGYDADGGWQNSAALSFGGEQGETVMLRANQFRSLLRSMITLVTGTRPSFTARPKTADTHAQAEARLAESILDFYISDYGLEDDTVDAAVYALLLGEGWLECRWDVNSGDPYDLETKVMPGQDEQIEANEEAEAAHASAMAIYGDNVAMAEIEGGDVAEVELPEMPELHEIETYEKIQYNGDLKFRALKPEDVIRDTFVQDLDDLQWVITRGQRNRWDLIAQFPEFREEILNAKRNMNRERLRSRVRRIKKSEDASTDLVDVYELWHVSCDALPRGRYGLMIDQTLLVDTEMPYNDLPIHSMIPSVEIDEPYGYGESWDLMALQQAYDATINTVISNHAAFGLQNIYTPPGSSLEVKDLGGGLKHVESLHKPEALDLLPSNSNSIELANMIKEIMQTISGVNDVARGEAAASQSGSALAMMATIAVQYNSGLQRAYGQMWEQVGTSLLRIFQRWASIPRTIEVAGRALIPQIREVSGSNIESVSSISVDLGNPLMRTAAGKKETADKLLQAKAITDPDIYMQVQATGRIDPLFNRPRSQRVLIESENERLMTGEPIKCLITDSHAQHIAEHTVLLNEPGTRFDDAIVSATDLHIREHTMLWAQASPLILAATGQQPPPPPPMMGMPAGGAIPGPPPAPGPNGGGGPSAEGPGMGPDMGQGGAAQQGKEPAMPQMPTNPMTGDKAPAGGAMS